MRRRFVVAFSPCDVNRNDRKSKLITCVLRSLDQVDRSHGCDVIGVCVRVHLKQGVVISTHSREKQPHRGHDDAILEVGWLRGRRYIGVRFQPRLAQGCIELVLSSLQPSIHRSENVHNREGFGASNGAVQLRRKSDLEVVDVFGKVVHGKFIRHALQVLRRLHHRCGVPKAFEVFFQRRKRFLENLLAEFVRVLGGESEPRFLGQIDHCFESERSIEVDVDIRLWDLTRKSLCTPFHHRFPFFPLLGWGGAGPSSGDEPLTVTQRYFQLLGGQPEHRRGPTRRVTHRLSGLRTSTLHLFADSALVTSRLETTSACISTPLFLIRN
eukprot:m.312608 g.312608  ORF g.312608 m.312608 type:complete len:326 (-) comp27467_c0_seq7:1121-2098(-)